MDEFEKIMQLHDGWQALKALMRLAVDAGYTGEFADIARWFRQILAERDSLRDQHVTTHAEELVAKINDLVKGQYGDVDMFVSALPGLLRKLDVIDDIVYRTRHQIEKADEAFWEER